METQDYEIDLLLKRYEHNKNRDEALAFYYMRAVVKFLARLVFAVGWDKLRPDATTEACRLISSSLFKDPHEARSTDSIEPGTFGFVLSEAAKMLSRRALVKAEIDLLYALGKERNVQSHDIYSVSFRSFYEGVEKALAAFNRLFEGKTCSYVVPLEDMANDRVQCLEFRKGVRDPCSHGPAEGTGFFTKRSI